MAKTYAIIYGFAEGPKNAKEFIKQCANNGLVQAPPNLANIIIAHSGGCFFSTKR